MKSKINLVILAPGFAVDDSDSITIPALQFYLRKLSLQYPGIEIQVITFHYPYTKSDYDWHGIPVHAAGGSRNKSLKILLWIKLLLYLLRLNGKKGIDLVHSFWLTDTTLVGLLFRALTGIPLVATAMGQDVTPRNKYLWLLRFSRFDLIAVSQFQANFLRGVFKRNLRHIIPFGVDYSRYPAGTMERNIDILAVGNLNRIKNHPDFVEIICTLVQSFPALNCMIIGEGNEQKQIENHIITLGLQKRILIKSHLTYGEVITSMQKSRILLHTSLFEGQGSVITEALAAGAYVVSYPVGTAFDFKNDKLRTGNTRPELEQQIISILNDRNPDYSPVIFFDIEETCKEYNAIYHTR